jgi:hypothetical protein
MPIGKYGGAKPLKYNTYSVGIGVLLIGSLAIALAFPRASADDETIPGSRYTSARSAALGEASLPLGDDGASALFDNPADLTKIRRPTLEPINLSGYFNTGFTSSAGLTNFYKATSLSGYSPELSSHPGSNVASGFQFAPNFATRYFAFGILMSSELNGESVNGQFRYRSQYQLIPTVATGFSLADGIVRVGYSLQWVNEAVGDVTAASAVGYNQNLPQGSGLSSNVGVALTFPFAYLPAFNFVARNLGGTHFSSSSIYSFSPSSTGAPATELASYDGSFSIQPKLSGGSYFNIVTEYRDMTNTSDMPWYGRIAGGVEFVSQRSFFLRGGWGSGYPSAGFGVRRAKGEFSLTWFSEELGTTYHSERDTRFMFQYQLRVF